MNTITIIFIIATVTTFIIGIILKKNNKVADYFPTLISSIGVIGTFVGIVMGLLHFNTENIGGSITELLDGLKTAFITSIAGMGLSFIFTVYSRWVDKDKISDNETDNILHNIRKLLEETTTQINNFQQQVSAANNKTIQVFELFSEQIKKNNTEALVEVMENVTENFNKSMNELLNGLVTQNFEQLNTSVQQLNTWQQENKQMITFLTNENKNIIELFSKSSILLSNVSQNINNLISSGGKFDNLIQELQRAIIEDTHFAELTEKLNNASIYIENASGLYNASMNNLTGFFAKYKQTQDSITALIGQLNNFNYPEKVEDLLQKINENYYKRFNITLQELDKCITAIIESKSQPTQRNLF